MLSAGFRHHINNKASVLSHPYMKKIICLIPFLFSLLILHSQRISIKNKKYPSLFWEISGNGLKKPSYLFGTMHVSNKIAFHLSDSFYIAIKNADVVSLETNPESWQDDMDKYAIGDDDAGYNDEFNFYNEVPNDYLTIQTLRFSRYEKQLEQVLYTEPSIINNLLYRSYSAFSSDFEEDTYLDLYIYQLGKKLGKKVSGVEDYGESMRLMMEAYRDAAKEKNKKLRSYDIPEGFSGQDLQEAYRSGNLDLLDSINRLNSESDAFDEKFLYRRNEIQAHSIDSILKRATLFVGVGAAHLPGQRGVIELLRRKGYKLRPIMMVQRDSRQKEQIEKLRVPVTFNTQKAEDGFFEVDIPGKFFRFNDYSALDQQQFSDMANGSYYIVTRLKIDPLLWGHTEEIVLKKIDSVLYENIPGKIIKKERISRNGYSGIDVINRTRRGNVQRYHIFVTPFEVIVFKMSGTGDYVLNGTEAARFFGSIRFREFRPNGWQTWQPAYGGFSAKFPHDPFESYNVNRQYEAVDKTTGSHFLVLRTDIHNYDFAGEDTFDLALMEESFASSEFIDKPLYRKQGKYKGYPSLDVTYRNKDHSMLKARFIIQGPHYYTVAVHSKKEENAAVDFLNSFEIKPFVYGSRKQEADTAMHFTVNTTWLPRGKKEKIRLSHEYYSEEDNQETYPGMDEDNFRSRLFSNDSTGEKIFLSFFKIPEYSYVKDSSALADFKFGPVGAEDRAWIVRSKKEYTLPGKMRVRETELSDTGSSRLIIGKTFYKDGIAYALVTMGDTLTPKSSFVSSFFDSFRPSDTLKGYNPFVKKTALFFDDYFSADSARRKKAWKGLYTIDLDTTDLSDVEKAIGSLSWHDKKYLETKKIWISKLGQMNSRKTSDYLAALYTAAGDTLELQYSILSALLSQKTQYAYTIFRGIMSADPPVLDVNSGNGYTIYPPLSALANNRNRWNPNQNENFMHCLYDTLKLTSTIFTGLLPLMSIDDYEFEMMNLLAVMIDSNLVEKKQYEMYFGKFLLEAKQELKKQEIGEKQKEIEKAIEEKEKSALYNNYYNAVKDEGNDRLLLFARLLLPFADSSPAVNDFFRRLLNSKDQRLKYNAALLMVEKDQPVPDSIFSHFAKMDEYRYELYIDLKHLKKEKFFPAAYNSHTELGRSRLLAMQQDHEKPDSLVYMDRVVASHKDRKGYIYFYKYKQKKDDIGWKLATVGLLPQDTTRFEFEETEESGDKTYGDYPDEFDITISYRRRYDNSPDDEYDFTRFERTRLKEDEPVHDQLNRLLKKMLYSKRKSAAVFYREYAYEDAAYPWINQVRFKY